MNSLAVAVFAIALAIANAGLITHSVIGPVAHGTTLQGPGTKTTLVGPDGSHIIAAAPGGVVHTAVDTGYAAHAIAPPAYVARHEIVAPVIAHGAPIVAHATSGLVAPAVIANAAPIVAHAARLVAHQASVVTPVVAPVIAHAAPVVVAARALPVHHVDPAFVAHGPHGAILAPGTGVEGEYQHDYTEILYDDGSYKGEFFNHHH